MTCDNYYQISTEKYKNCCGVLPAILFMLSLAILILTGLFVMILCQSTVQSSIFGKSLFPTKNNDFLNAEAWQKHFNNNLNDNNENDKDNTLPISNVWSVLKSKTPKELPKITNEFEQLLKSSKSGENKLWNLLFGLRQPQNDDLLSLSSMETTTVKTDETENRIDLLQELTKLVPKIIIPNTEIIPIIEETTPNEIVELKLLNDSLINQITEPNNHKINSITTEIITTSTPDPKLFNESLSGEQIIVTTTVSHDDDDNNDDDGVAVTDEISDVDNNLSEIPPEDIDQIVSDSQQSLVTVNSNSIDDNDDNVFIDESIHIESIINDMPDPTTDNNSCCEDCEEITHTPSTPNIVSIDSTVFIPTTTTETPLAVPLTSTTINNDPTVVSSLQLPSTIIATGQIPLESTESTFTDSPMLLTLDRTSVSELPSTTLPTELIPLESTESTLTDSPILLNLDHNALSELPSTIIPIEQIPPTESTEPTFTDSPMLLKLENEIEELAEDSMFQQLLPSPRRPFLNKLRKRNSLIRSQTHAPIIIKNPLFGTNSAAELKSIEKTLLDDISTSDGDRSNSNNDKSINYTKLNSKRSAVANDCIVGMPGDSTQPPVAVTPKGQPSFFETLQNETSEERSIRLQKTLQKMMNMITIFGHIDRFLTKRFKTGIRKIAKLYDSGEDHRRRRRGDKWD